MTNKTAGRTNKSKVDFKTQLTLTYCILLSNFGNFLKARTMVVESTPQQSIPHGLGWIPLLEHVHACYQTISHYQSDKTEIPCFKIWIAFTFWLQLTFALLCPTLKCCDPQLMSLLMCNHIFWEHWYVLLSWLHQLLLPAFRTGHSYK